MADPLAYLNGQMVPASAACLPVYDAGVVLGATVSEQTRTFGKQPYRLEEHVARLFESARCLGLDMPVTISALVGVSRELVAHNGRLLDDRGELGVIHLVTPGAYATYAGMAGAAVSAGPTICVHTFPLPFGLWAAKMKTGVHLVTPPTRHVPPLCYDANLKYRSRLHFYLAEQEARLVDPRAAALLLDIEGNITETASANFLMVKDGVLWSPLARNILAGVSKATVMELAAELGIAFRERNLDVLDAANADEAFLASTPYCLMPATRLNGRPIGSGLPGPVYRRLLKAWSERVGLDIEKQILAGGGVQA